jgi:hypothetical protein
MNRFASLARELRGWTGRNTWARRYGLTERGLQDLEQGRALPSRAMVLWLVAIQRHPLVMQEVAQLAKAELAELEVLRTRKANCG